MLTDWTIEAGAGCGVLVHHTAPRFKAKWISGHEDIGDSEGLCWTNEGSGEDDTIHIFDFIWTDATPDQVRFEALMCEAEGVIDAWISDRL